MMNEGRNAYKYNNIIIKIIVVPNKSIYCHHTCATDTKQVPHLIHFAHFKDEI